MGSFVYDESKRPTKVRNLPSGVKFVSESLWPPYRYTSGFTVTCFIFDRISSISGVFVCFLIF